MVLAHSDIILKHAVHNNAAAGIFGAYSNIIVVLSFEIKPFYLLLIVILMRAVNV